MPLLNETARVLATSLDASVRNGSEAVETGAKGREAHRIAGIAAVLDTLAAAYAECGRFAEAVDTAKEAVKLAAATGQRRPDRCSAYEGRPVLSRASPLREAAAAEVTIRGLVDWGLGIGSRGRKPAVLVTRSASS